VEPSADPVARGVKRFNEGRFAEAEAEFDRAVSRDGSAPDARLLKAFCRQALGDAAGARREMERTLRRFPASAAACAQFGQLCAQQGRLDRALSLARRAERLDPRHLPAYRQQASALAALGRRREALEVLRRARRAAPRDAAVRCDAASAHLELGERREALVLAREAARLEPESARAARLEADALAGLDRPREALAALRGALRLEPRSAELWCEAASAHARLHDWRETRRCAREALRRDPKRAQASGLEAIALWSRGRPAEGLAVLRRALRAAPEDVELWVGLAKVQAVLGSARKARAALVQASQRGLTEELLRGVVPVLTDKAEALRDKGWLARADALMRLALECVPGDPAVWFKQGVLLRHRRRLIEADAAYEKSCALRPDDLRTYLYRAETLMARGRVEEVFRVLRRARSLCPPPERGDDEGRLRRYRLSASLFDFAEAARIGEAVLNGGPRLRNIEGLCWPILVEDFELVRRPPEFLRRAEAALARLPRRGKTALWGRHLSAGFALLPGAAPSLTARALAGAGALRRLPRSRYAWMRYVTGCLRRSVGDDEAALADFRAASRATRPANWLALFHESEILLSRGRRAEAVRRVTRLERLVPGDRRRDYLIKKGWFMLDAGRRADARRAFERVAAGASAPDAARGLRAVRARRAALTPRAGRSRSRGARRPPAPR